MNKDWNVLRQELPDSKRLIVVETGLTEEEASLMINIVAKNNKNCNVFKVRGTVFKKDTITDPNINQG